MLHYIFSVVKYIPYNMFAVLAGFGADEELVLTLSNHSTSL